MLPVSQFFPYGYIAVVSLLFAFILFIGRDKPPKGKGHPGYAESRKRLYWWHKIWRTREGQDHETDWSRD